MLEYILTMSMSLMYVQRAVEAMRRLKRAVHFVICSQVSVPITLLFQEHNPSPLSLWGSSHMTSANIFGLLVTVTLTQHISTLVCFWVNQPPPFCVDVKCEHALSSRRLSSDDADVCDENVFMKEATRVLVCLAEVLFRLIRGWVFLDSSTNNIH